MASSTNRTVLFIIALILLVNAVLLYSARLLPFTDLPNHLVEATIYKYATDGTLLRDYYKAVPWYYPNTFHTVFCSLFPSVEFGNKTYYFIYVSLLLLSMYGIIKALKGNLWYGLLSVLFIYNYNVTSGFSGFSLSIAATFLLFYVILRDVQTGRPRYTLAAALLLVLIYLMHAQMGLFGLMLYGLSMLYRHWGNWKALVVKAVLVPLPVVAMVATWWANRAAAAPNEQSTLAYLAGYYKRLYLGSLPMRARLVVFDNFSLRAGITGLAIAGFLFLLVFLPLLYYKSWKQLGEKSFVKSNLVYPVILLLVSAGCYFVLPNKLPGQALIYERMSVTVLLSLIIIGSVLLREVHTRGIRYFVTGAALIYLCLWGEYFYTFNQQNRDFRPAFFNGVPNNAVLGGLMYKYLYRGRYLYLHFPGYHIVWNKGLATTKSIDYRFGVVTRAERGNAIPFYREWIGRDYLHEKKYDTTLRYVVVHGKPPVQPDSNLLNKTLLRQAGAWQLYQNNSVK